MPYDPRLAMLLDMLEAQQRQNVPKYSKGGKIVDLLLGPASTASLKSRRKVLGLDTENPVSSQEIRDIYNRIPGIPPGTPYEYGQEYVSKGYKPTASQLKGGTYWGPYNTTVHTAPDKYDPPEVHAIYNRIPGILPMSRRDVLRAGVGQAVRGMMPQGALGSLRALAGESTPSVSNALNEAIDQITSKPAFRPSPSSDAGRMAAALYKIAGRTKKGSPDFSKGNIKNVYDAEVDIDDFTYDNSMPEFLDTFSLLSNPERHIGHMLDYTEPEDLLTQGDVLALGVPRDLYSRDFYPGTSMMNFKDLLRVMRQNDPKRYDDLKTFIREVELGGDD